MSHNGNDWILATLSSLPKPAPYSQKEAENAARQEYLAVSFAKHTFLFVSTSAIALLCLGTSFFFGTSTQQAEIQRLENEIHKLDTQRQSLNITYLNEKKADVINKMAGKTKISNTLKTASGISGLLAILSLGVAYKRNNELTENIQKNNAKTSRNRSGR